MAVALDSVSGTAAFVTNSSSFTDSSLTVSSGSNRALIYAISFGWSTYTQPTSINVTWDQSGSNQSLSLLEQSPNTTGNILTQLWGLVAPTSGNKTITVSWASTVDAAKGAGISLLNVDQTGGATTFNNTNNNSGGISDVVSVSVITTSNDAVIVGAAGTGPGSFGGFTSSIFHSASGILNAAAGYELNGTTASLSLDAGYTHWNSAGVNVKGHTLTPVHTVSPSSELISVQFTGIAGSGAISVPGLKTGDKLLWLESSSYQTGPVQFSTAGYFEIIVSTDDYLQQTTTLGLNDWLFNAIFVRGL